MSGYIGTKSVTLSTTSANVGGDSTVGGDLTVDTNTFYVDSTNNRVGVGTVSPTQALDVTGDIVTSGGVYLGGTVAANYLDDYEEGTWTPTLSGNTTAGTMTGNTAGRYTKIGNQVFIEFRLDNVTLSGAAGTIKISGLPFTASYGTNNTYSIATVTQMYNFAFTTDARQSLYPTNGGTVLFGLESRNSNNWVDWSVTNTSNLYMNVNMFYITTQ